MIFTKIPGLPYELSKIGEIKRINSTKLLKTNLGDNGYLRISLFINGKTRNVYLHRMLALTFIANPENKKTVNHKDGNKLNNNLDNLEWLSNYENVKHAMGNRLKYIKQVDLKGNVIKIYPSTHSVKKDGFDQSCVWRCCNNQRYKKYKGYKWSYVC